MNIRANEHLNKWTLEQMNEVAARAWSLNTNRSKMKHIRIILIMLSTLGIFFSCNSGDSKKQSGISLNQATENEEASDIEGNGNSKKLRTRPGKILLTGQKDHRVWRGYQ